MKQSNQEKSSEIQSACSCKDIKITNADRIRSMRNEELADWLTNMCGYINSDDEEPYKSIYNINTEKEEIVHDSYGSILDWLQMEAKR